MENRRINPKDLFYGTIVVLLYLWVEWVDRADWSWGWFTYLKEVL